MIDESARNTHIEEPVNNLDFRDVLLICVGHWRWYLATVAVALVVAFFYIKKTEPTFKREASIMVLDGNQESSALSKLLADFTDMGFSFSDKANVNNVIAAIQSPDVMSEVVRKLGIDIVYTAPGAFYDATLYGKTLPVTVMFHDVAKDETASLSLKFLGDGNVEMSDFVRNGEVIDSETLQCRLGQTVHTPVGILTIKPTEHHAAAVKRNRRVNVRKRISTPPQGIFSVG